jgi:hypothetical protein
MTLYLEAGSLYVLAVKVLEFQVKFIFKNKHVELSSHFTREMLIFFQILQLWNLITRKTPANIQSLFRSTLVASQLPMFSV